MSFFRRGAGKDVLLLHGYGSKKESFYYQINFLEKNYRVTAADFPAFGASEAPDSAWSVGDYAEWLKKFIRISGLEKPHIIAHSFGARVAIKLVSENPELCGKLIITGGAGLVKPRSPQYIRRVKRYRFFKKIFPRFAERHFGSEEYKKLSPVMKESYKKIVNEDLREFAKKIPNETLLIYGKDDAVTPANEEGETFSRLIENSTLVIVDGGHFTFSEYPQNFNTVISQFLSE